MGNFVAIAVVCKAACMSWALSHVSMRAVELGTRTTTTTLYKTYGRKCGMYTCGERLVFAWIAIPMGIGREWMMSAGLDGQLNPTVNCVYRSVNRAVGGFGAGGDTWHV